MADWLNQWRFHVKRTGLDYCVYDLGGLGYGTPYRVAPDAFEKPNGEIGRNNFKADLLLRTWETYPDQNLLWLDIDAFLLHGDLSPLFRDDCGVTVKTAAEWENLVDTGRTWATTINSGVVACSPAALPLVQEWSRLDAGRQYLSDQQTLGEGILNNPTAQRGKMTVLGCTVGLYDTHRWNNYYLTPLHIRRGSLSLARIIHFKGSTRAYRRQLGRLRRKSRLWK